MMDPSDLDDDHEGEPVAETITVSARCAHCGTRIRMVTEDDPLWSVTEADTRWEHWTR